MIENNDFLGREVAAGGEERVFVVSVPLEFTTSYMKGAAEGPASILAASRQIELYNSGLDIDLEGAGITTIDPGVESREDFLAFLAANRERLASGFACFLGGEHSITPWILEGMRYGEIGIVWLDAHADLRPEYQGDKESHACAARNSLAFGRIVEIGVRSFSREEKEYIGGEERVRVFSRFGRNALEAIDQLPERVYLSLDFDGIDPSVIRAVGTPEPGGLMWPDLIDILDVIFTTKTVVGMDAVELCPMAHDEASSFIAARAVYEAISRHLARAGKAGR